MPALSAELQLYSITLSNSIKLVVSASLNCFCSLQLDSVAFDDVGSAKFSRLRFSSVPAEFFQAVIRALPYQNFTDTRALLLVPEAAGILTTNRLLQS